MTQIDLTVLSSVVGGAEPDAGPEPFSCAAGDAAWRALGREQAVVRATTPEQQKIAPTLGEQIGANLFERYCAQPNHK